MNCVRQWQVFMLLAVATGLAACETLPENLVAKPEVSLREVQVVGLGFNGQTFLLSFDVRNPNPFPLPVNHVSYGVRLDGERFATGRTPCNFNVPAGETGRFAISVDLDLLKTAPALLSIVREGARREVPYELEGEFSIDIPMTPPVRYRSKGAIRLQSGGL